jgi:predicted lipoprotein with Yx(FWY)xxD motif
VLALAGTAVVAASATAAPASITVVHSLQTSSLGIILVGAGGRTLYHDSAEAKNVVKCTGACSTHWPPLLIAPGAKPAAGPGVTPSWLGTVQRPDGKLQVTYRGMPLYLFAGDKKAGDVKGQGGSGIWHAIKPSGAIVTKGANVASKSSSSTSSRSSGSGSTSGSTSGSGSTSTSGGSGTSDPNAAYCAANPMGCINGVPINGA